MKRMPRRLPFVFLKKLSVYVLIPRMKTFAHFFHSLGLLCGKVILFADVIRQIVEMNSPVFIALNEFELAFTNRAAGIPP